MQRTLLCVRAEDGDWRVELDGRELACHPGRHAAIDAARQLARNRHEITGEPTGVVAPMCNGEVVVLETCGLAEE